jgi:hypothetical protein
MSNGELGTLVAEVSHLRRQVGDEGDEHEPPSGLVGRLTRLEQLIGEAPNDATGSPGTGLCGVVADTARTHRQQRALMLKLMAFAGVVLPVLVTVLVEIVKGWK